MKTSTFSIVSFLRPFKITCTFFGFSKFAYIKITSSLHLDAETTAFSSSDTMANPISSMNFRSCGSVFSFLFLICPSTWLSNSSHFCWYSSIHIFSGTYVSSTLFTGSSMPKKSSGLEFGSFLLGTGFYFVWVMSANKSSPFLL